MVNLEITKMNGHGNDFIIVDNRDGRVGVPDMPGLTRSLCRRRMSVGADGMLFIENGPPEVDFKWRFYNSDGSVAEMCGNAGRCTARFAYMNGIAPAEMKFLTVAGVIKAWVNPHTVKIQMTQPSAPDMECPLDLEGTTITFCNINTGVPHAVTWVEDVEAAQVVDIGRKVRFHPHFSPSGTNADFVQLLDDGRLAVRTYERGVEDETLACGTGVIASVLLSAVKGLVSSPARAVTRGGEELVVHFELEGETFNQVYLEGPVRLVYTGRLGPEATL